jgi:hypothetical protein
MDIDLRKQLEQVISTHLSWFRSQSEIFVNEFQLGGKLNVGCWSNDQGILAGWISYNNSPIEESIEVNFTLAELNKNNMFSFDIDICWSNGELIYTFFDHVNLRSVGLEETINELIGKLKYQILSEFKNQISIVYSHN